MLMRIISGMTRPFTAYLEVTLAAPCQELCKMKSPEKRARKDTATNFSFIKHIRKQWENVSPECGAGPEIHSVRQHYLKETPFVDSPWMH